MSTIDYATGPRRHGWLRRHRRAIAVGVVLLGIAGVAIRSRGAIGRYVRWRLAHAGLVRFRMPTGPAAKKPAGMDADDVGAIGGGSVDVAVPAVDALIRLDASVALEVTGSATPPTKASRYAFVGQRRRPDGRWRTVVLTPIARGAQFMSVSRIAVIAGPTWQQVPADPPPPTGFWTFGGRAWDGPIGIPVDAFVTADPLDPSAIRVDGQLRDGNTLEPDGPAVRWSGRLTDADTIAWTVDGRPVPAGDYWTPMQ